MLRWIESCVEVRLASWMRTRKGEPPRRGQRRTRAGEALGSSEVATSLRFLMREHRTPEAAREFCCRAEVATSDGDSVATAT